MNSHGIPNSFYSDNETNFFVGSERHVKVFRDFIKRISLVFYLREICIHISLLLVALAGIESTRWSL